MRKTARGLSIYADVGITTFHGDDQRSVSMLSSQRDVSLGPCNIHISHAWHNVIDRVYLAGFQLKDTIQDWLGFFSSAHHHQRSAAQTSQPDFGLKAQSLTVGFYNLMSSFCCLNIYLKCLSQAA